MSVREIEDAARAVYVPFVCGTISWWLGRGKSGSGNAAEHSHKWTVFVRGPDNRDITYAVAKVVFTLHSSFQNHIRGERGEEREGEGADGQCSCMHRVGRLRFLSDRRRAGPSVSIRALAHPPPRAHPAEMTAPPFEVSETGWGEFEIGIKIYLRDPAAEPISLVHMLRLYPLGPPSTERPVISETYDEVVFNTLPADAAARAALLAGPGPDPPAYPYQEWLTSFDAEAELAVLQAARQYVADRKLELEDRLVRGEAEHEALRKDLAALGAI
jgi:YEATS domain-containing protein 4